VESSIKSANSSYCFGLTIGEHPRQSVSQTYVHISSHHNFRRRRILIQKTAGYFGIVLSRKIENDLRKKRFLPLPTHLGGVPLKTCSHRSPCRLRGCQAAVGLSPRLTGRVVHSCFADFSDLNVALGDGNIEMRKLRAAVRDQGNRLLGLPLANGADGRGVLSVGFQSMLTAPTRSFSGDFNGQFHLPASGFARRLCRLPVSRPEHRAHTATWPLGPVCTHLFRQHAYVGNRQGEQKRPKRHEGVGSAAGVRVPPRAANSLRTLAPACSTALVSSLMT